MVAGFMIAGPGLEGYDSALVLSAQCAKGIAPRVLQLRAFGGFSQVQSRCWCEFLLLLDQWGQRGGGGEKLPHRRLRPWGMLSDGVERCCC